MTARPNILLLGANGQVGYELQRSLPHVGAVTPLARDDADLRDADQLRAAIRRHRPQVIVNAAAYTAVDKSEQEPDVAHQVNAVAPGVLAAEAHAMGASIVHYSTDYVFDGRKESHYDETDAPEPLSVYGRSKLAGERAVAAACERHLILRTSWIFGVHGANFLKTILRLAQERETLRVVVDQIGAPTSAELIADVTASALRALFAAPAQGARWGVYHLAAAGETSWHGYACHIVDVARRDGARLQLEARNIVPITTGEYGAPAARPANSRLNTSKLRTAFGLTLPHWVHGVDRALKTLLATS